MKLHRPSPFFPRRPARGSTLRPLLYIVAGFALIAVAIVVLLQIASWMEKKDTTRPATRTTIETPQPAASQPASPPAQSSPELAAAEANVRQVIARVNGAKAQLAQASRHRDNLHAQYKGKNLPSRTYQAVMKQYQAADEAVARAQHQLDAAMSAFETAFAQYQNAGGTTDYRSAIQ